MTLRRWAGALLATALLSGGAVIADEGMWTFDNLPLEQLKERYGFEPPEGWVEHLRSAAVRFNNGGSGSFVSPDGLIMTNHHVGADMLHKISTAEKDYFQDGFYARSRAEEIAAPDLELNVLVGIEDVTDRVNAGVRPDMPDAEAATLRRRAMADIEKESMDKTGLRSDVVTLYQGGRYALYTYKRYTDVRLVFAPEFAAAFFGGDADNFEYPRYDLDVCFFRAYEGGKPAKIEHALKWSKDGSKEGDLVFVAGHPGRTDRLNTVAHLKYLRDTAFPFQLDYLRDRERFLQEYSSLGEEQARQAKDDLFGVQNSRKARIGGLAGLRDEPFMDRKQAAEQTVRDTIAADVEQARRYGDAWDRIAASHETAAEILEHYSFLERGLAFNSQLFRIARDLVRLAEESPKPNAERLRGYQEANLDSLRQRLFSTAPIYKEYEEASLASSLSYWQTKMGPDDPVVRQVLRGRTPEETARELVEGTQIALVPVRKALYDGGLKAIEASNDPMIALARAIDPYARAVRKRYEDEVEGVQSTHYARIARAQFEAQGATTYPDATFTLRLAFGTVRGYEVDGLEIPPYTTFAGAFEHAREHNNEPPYRLPASWVKAKDSGALKLDTPLNFVSTADIFGGNSGSPVVDRDGAVVGLIFDGNIHSLVLDFGYDDRYARAVSVDSRAIVEALRSIYGADALVEELTGPRE